MEFQAQRSDEGPIVFSLMPMDSNLVRPFHKERVDLMILHSVEHVSIGIADANFEQTFPSL